MSASVALRDLVVSAFIAVMVAVWIEPVREKLRARRLAAELAEARHQADVRAARGLLDRTDEQAVRDAAYAKAEEQALAAAETGLGWQMPSREQYAAVAYDGTHERLLMTQADRALEVALLEGEFFHESRPPIAADTDPDGTTAW